jgi:hypothetical protein
VAYEIVRFGKRASIPAFQAQLLSATRLEHATTFKMITKSWRLGPGVSVVDADGFPRQRDDHADCGVIIDHQDGSAADASRSVLVIPR